jgi:2-polyprenyl-3-methyl-5-hydroxy-6-metoxy-1,4-benzoquinol methylase
MRSRAVEAVEQQHFYDDLWKAVDAQSLNQHERARLATITRVLEKHVQTGGTRIRILEVGCGRGWLSGLLLRRLGDVIALDLSPRSIQSANEAFPDVDFRVQDISAAPLPGDSDLLVSSEVLEHIPDQAAAMRQFADAVKPRGLMLLTTPNARWRQRWLARPLTRPQPVENWLLPSELRALVAPYFDTLVQTTFFVPWDHGSRPGRVMLALDRRLGALRPSRLIERLGGGLYSVLLARRRAD